VLATILGTAFLAALLAIAIFMPNPTATQIFTFRVVLSVAAAAFVSTVPGFLTVEIGGWLRAGGALAALAIVYLVNPPAIVGQNAAEPAGETAPGEAVSGS
jgi:hypothetical protein